MPEYRLSGTSLCDRSFFLLALFVLLGFSQPAFPQTPSFEGQRILEIRYEPAQQPLAPSDLKRVQILETGAALHSADVAESIDRMYATGRYEDIQVDAEPGSGGVVISFLTKNARFVGHVGTSGKVSNPPTRGQIGNAAQLQLGTPFHPEDLNQAQKNIQQLFISNGLYESTVHLENSESDPQQVNVNIVVNAGKRARYEMPVIHGDTKSLSDAAIIRATGWRVVIIHRWRQVTQSLTSKGVEGVAKKYQNMDRRTASVQLESLNYDHDTGRAQPTLDINAGPKIEIKALEAKVSKRKLTQFIPIYQEGGVDQDLLVEGARNLRDYFQSQGYPDVDVTFRELPPQQDEQTIEYFISRGVRQKLVRIEIHGNRYFTEGTLRERMFLEPSSIRFRHGRYSDGFRRKDEQTIADLYKQNGFRDARVTSSVVNNYQGKPQQIAVIFSIDEGAQWLVARLDLTGVDDLDKDAILRTLASQPGQPYSDASVAIDASVLVILCNSHGFPSATFQSSASPAGPPHQVNLRYSVTEGPHNFVRDVLITGLRNTRLKLVENNIKIQSADPLSQAAIREAQRELYQLGIFSQVDTAIQNPDGSETYKYVIFDFNEASRYTINVGVGAQIARIGATSNNLTTPSGTTGFSPRLSVNVNRLDMFGLGHTLALQTRLSNIEQLAALSYLFPKLNNKEGRTLTFSGLYDLTRDVTTFSSRREQASVQISQKFSRAITALMRFQYRRVSVTNIVIPALLIPQLVQPVRIGILSGNLVRDHRDNPADPHGGSYTSVDLGLASSVFASQRNFTRLLARNAGYYQIGKNLVLARQLTFGAIVPYHTNGLTSSDAVPLPERFFSGGSISDRAFPENQAGPRDIGTPAGPGGTATQPTGFPLGGNALLFSNLELRFPLLGENIGGVLFWDAGNVYSDVSNISFRFHQRNLQDFDYMVHAVGFGLRYKTLIGPLRADFAYGLNPPRFVGFNGTYQQLLQCNPNLPSSQLPAVCTPVPQGLSHFQFFFSIGQTF